MEPRPSLDPATDERAALERALAACAQSLERGSRFLVVMHEFPDGDALGSALALAAALRGRGRDVTVYSPQGAPNNLRFLPGAGEIVHALPGDARFDVSIACDAGDDSRLGPDYPAQRERRGEVLNIDHHPRCKAFGDVNFVDPGAAAVGVLVFRILERLGHPIGPEIATCLWVSLATDTGNFRHSNTNAECMRIACRLVEAGARPGEISSRMYEAQPLSRVKLLAEVLRTLSLSRDGAIAWVVARQRAFDLVGTAEETTDGFISYPRSIAGVEVALLFREEAPGRFRVSFRSRGKVDVGAIATRFGGGGHHNASGCLVPGAFEDVRGLVLREVRRGLARVRGRPGAKDGA